MTERTGGPAPSTEVAVRPPQSEAAQMLSQIVALVVNPDIPDSRLDLLFALQKELIAVDSLVFVVAGTMTHSGGFERRVHTPSLPIADLASFVAAALSTFAWLVSPSRRARARKERASIARRLAESRP